MDRETLAKVGAIVRQVTVSYERKVSDGNYGSVGGTFHTTADVGEDADPNAAALALYAWTKEVATEALKPSFEGVVQHAQQPAPVQQEPVRVPQTDDSETDVFDVASYEIAYSPKGQKQLKVKGGKWTKFGVTVWPEVAEQAAQLEGWDSRDAGEYQIAGKLKAVVLMDAGKPKKVVGWQ